jgi:nucleoside-diphosphate-sugar epimerase
VRAQSGPTAPRGLTERDEPQPSEAYGRCKLKAEAAVRACAVASTVLRSVMVFGPGVKGNLASLMHLADTPWPLPFASFTNERSLVSLENLVSAITFVLGAEASIGETYIVADPKPVTTAEIVAALREGAGRPRRLYPVPPALFAAGFKAIGRGDIWERLGRRLVADPEKLMAAGWRPDPDTKAALIRMAAAVARARAS